MRVNIDRMIEETEGVSTVESLADLLNEKSVDISARTLFRWRNGGFHTKKVEAAAVALKMELKDIIILE